MVRKSALGCPGDCVRVAPLIVGKLKGDRRAINADPYDEIEVIVEEYPSTGLATDLSRVFRLPKRGLFPRLEDNDQYDLEFC